MNTRLALAAVLLTTTALFAATPAPKTAAAPEPELLAVGVTAPNFSAQQPNGSAMSLASYKGKVVLVDFWATWCGPCLASMPHMEAVYQKYKDKGLVVIGVCVWDEKASFDAWQKQPKVPTTYAKVFDPAGRNTTNSIASKLYKVSGIPTFYLIDQKGKVAYAGVGSGGQTEAGLDKALAQIFAASAK